MNSTNNPVGQHGQIITLPAPLQGFPVLCTRRPVGVVIWSCSAHCCPFSPFWSRGRGVDGWVGDGFLRPRISEHNSALRQQVTLSRRRCPSKDKKIEQHYYFCPSSHRCSRWLHRPGGGAPANPLEWVPVIDPGVRVRVRAEVQPPVSEQMEISSLHQDRGNKG